MRFYLSIVLIACSQMGWGQSAAPWQFALNTGATSYLGVAQGPRSQGAFLSTFVTRRDLGGHVRATGSLSQGSFGLTAVPYNRSIERIQGGSLGIQVHPNWSASHRVNPHVGLAVGRFGQVAWVDAMNAEGQPYHVWSDGQLYDMPEDAPYARLLAQTQLPDYEFDTQLAQGGSWGIPVQFGLDWQLSDAWTMEAAGRVYFGVSPVAGPVDESLTAISLGIGWRPGSNLFEDPNIPEEYLRLRADADQDGVRDRRDRCYNTPKGARVDGRGCPTDSDGDGVADYLDLEPSSLGPVDLLGRSLCNLPRLDAPELARLPHWDFQQIISDPSTGTRPHLPMGQAHAQPKTQPAENP
jgi:hypothetical protein